MNNTKEKQHTVPQFILRNFSINNKVYTYDKYTEKVYRSNVKDSGCERNFYDFKIKTPNGVVEGTIEEKLCELEYYASRVVKKILEHDTLVDITDDDKDHLAYFLAAQMVRTQNVKINYKSMPEQLRNVLKQRMPNLANDDSLNEKIPDFDDKELNFWFDILIANLTEDLKPYFKRLEWILVRTDESKPFLIGDAPVVVYNELYYDKEESFSFSKYAIGYRGSCVFFPISPIRALWLVAPEFIEQYVQEVIGMVFLRIKSAEDVDNIGEEVQDCINKEVGFTKTKELMFSSHDIDRYNHFEIINAERKIFSKCSDFKQVEVLIKKNKFRKHGMRIKAH